VLLQATDTGHVHIHQHHIGGVSAAPFYGIFATAAFTGNFNTFISSRMRRIPARTSSWSSTRRTLIKGNVSRIGITLLTANLVYINGFLTRLKR
jgi:hypothetical protein